MDKIREELADVPDDSSSSGGSNPVSGTSNGSTGWLSLDSDSPNTKGFRTGGLNTKTGWQLLHGTQDAPERILSAEQTRNFDYMVEQLPELNKAIDKITVNHNIGNSSSPIVIENITLPQVENATDFVDELYKVVDGLSFQAGIQNFK